jgi:hypothetical protein
MHPQVGSVNHFESGNFPFLSPLGMNIQHKIPGGPQAAQPCISAALRQFGATAGTRAFPLRATSHSM